MLPSIDSPSSRKEIPPRAVPPQNRLLPLLAAGASLLSLIPVNPAQAQGNLDQINPSTPTQQIVLPVELSSTVVASSKENERAVKVLKDMRFGNFELQQKAKENPISQSEIARNEASRNVKSVRSEALRTPDLKAMTRSFLFTRSEKFINEALRDDLHPDEAQRILDQLFAVHYNLDPLQTSFPNNIDNNDGKFHPLKYDQATIQSMVAEAQSFQSNTILPLIKRLAPIAGYSPQKIDAIIDFATQEFKLSTTLYISKSTAESEAYLGDLYKGEITQNHLAFQQMQVKLIAADIKTLNEKEPKEKALETLCNYRDILLRLQSDHRISANGPIPQMSNDFRDAKSQNTFYMRPAVINGQEIRLSYFIKFRSENTQKEMQAVIVNNYNRNTTPYLLDVVNESIRNLQPNS
jgi:hypothetical protein